MFGAIARRLFGTANDRIVKGLKKTSRRSTPLSPP